MESEIDKKINNVENEILLKELKNLQAKYLELSLLYDKCQNKLSAFSDEQVEKVNFIINYVFSQDFSDTIKHENSIWKYIKNKVILKKNILRYCEQVKNEFNQGGFIAARNYISKLALDKNNESSIWEYFAKFLKSIDIKIAAEAAWHAWLCNRSFNNLKTVALFMYAADEIFLANLLFSIMPPDAALSEDEKEARDKAHKKYKVNRDSVVDVANLRSKIVNLEFENKKLKRFETDKKNLLYLNDIKDEYIRLINEKLKLLEKSPKN